jgi:hypothetical protein
LQAWQKKDTQQMLADEAEGKPEHEGFIYILSNDAMPGLLKIGYTTKLVEKRAGAIAAATGVPSPFKVWDWRRPSIPGNKTFLIAFRDWLRGDDLPFVS